MKTNDLFNKGLFDIAQTIAASISGDLDENDRKQLENWKNASPENERLYKKMVRQEFRIQKQQEFHSYPLPQGWQAFQKKRNQQKRSRIYRSVIQYAALLIFALGLGYYFYHPEFSTSGSVPLQSVQFQPGSNRAQLILADGETIDLAQHQGRLQLEGQSTEIHNQNNRLSYEHSNTDPISEPTKMIFNEISVPRCGEYQLKLSDGTLVYLNSMTKIHYPVSFTGNTREVSLTGEAYFSVAHDPLHPFVVHTSTHDITVLGTEFNITTFQEDNEVRTTLVNGKVRIDGGRLNRPVILKPHEQFVYDKQQGQFKVQTVDVSYHIAWKDGHFRFRDVRLEEIMRTIERWYDVEVVYADPETKDYTFGLNFSRNETIDPILRIFQENGKINITTKGKTLIINKGR